MGHDYTLHPLHQSLQHSTPLQTSHPIVSFHPAPASLPQEHISPTSSSTTPTPPLQHQEHPNFFHLVTSKPAKVSKSVRQAWSDLVKSHPSMKALDKAKLSNEQYALEYSRLYHEDASQSDGKKMASALKNHLVHSNNKSTKDQEDILKHLSRIRGTAADKAYRDSRKRKLAAIGIVEKRIKKQQIRNEFLGVEQEADTFAQKMREAKIDSNNLTPQELEVKTRNLDTLYGGDRKKSGQDMVTYMEVMNMDIDDIKEARLARTSYNKSLKSKRNNARWNKKKRDELRIKKGQMPAPMHNRDTTFDILGRPLPSFNTVASAPNQPSNHALNQHQHQDQHPAYINQGNARSNNDPTHRSITDAQHPPSSSRVRRVQTPALSGGEKSPLHLPIYHATQASTSSLGIIHHSSRPNSPSINSKTREEALEAEREWLSLVNDLAPHP